MPHGPTARTDGRESFMGHRLRRPVPLPTSLHYLLYYLLLHSHSCTYASLPAIAGAVATAPTGADPYLQQGVP